MSDEDLARLEASGDPDVLAVTAKVHMARSRPAEAVAALGRAIDRLKGQDAPGSRPVPVWLPRGLLALEAAGMAGEARALHSRLWEWLSGPSDASLVKRWGESHPWQVAHELGLLDPEFPRELRRAAALATLTGDAAPALEEVARYARKHPAQAEQVSGMLYDLPLLYSFYYRTLQGIDPGDSPRLENVRGLLSVFRYFIPIIALTSLLSRCPDDKPMAEQAQAYKAAKLQQEAGEAWGELDGDCDGGAPRLPKGACAAAKSAAEKLRVGDCQGAHESLDSVNAVLNEVGPASMGNLRSFEARILMALASWCGAYELPPSPPGGRGRPSLPERTPPSGQ